MNFRKVRNLILKDLYQYQGDKSMKVFFKSYFLIPGFNHMLWSRLCQYWNNNIFQYISIVKRIRYAIQIPAKMNIGRGFYISHFNGNVIGSGAQIGSNCYISQNVAIGSSPIGDNCYIAHRVEVIGNNVTMVRMPW